MWVAGYLALVQGDAAAARRWLQDALAAGQRLGDARAVAYASQFLGRAVWFTGEPDRGAGLTEEARRRRRAAGDWPGVALTLVQLGAIRTLTEVRLLRTSVIRIKFSSPCPACRAAGARTVLLQSGL